MDFGKFASSLGYEGNYTKDQMNYSRSFWFNYLPFYHFGFRNTYNFNSKVSAQYWLVNGANQSEDFNGFKSQAFQLVLKPNKAVSLTSTYYFGQEARQTTGITVTYIPYSGPIVFGVHGELKVLIETDFPERFSCLKRVFVGGVEYETESARLHRFGVMLKRTIFTVPNAQRRPEHRIVTHLEHGLHVELVRPCRQRAGAKQQYRFRAAHLHVMAKAVMHQRRSAADVQHAASQPLKARHHLMPFERRSRPPIHPARGRLQPVPLDVMSQQIAGIAVRAQPRRMRQQPLRQ